jgi:drug/metabolite transporter (DMT)-like permease
MSAGASLSREARGLRLGLLGVCGFSLTLPMTRIAVAELDPVFAGLGRSLVSVVLALGVLAWKRDRFPGARHLPIFLTIALGVIVGFPLLTAFALRRVPASHGAVVIAVLPLFTALCGTLRARDRPSPLFWLAAFVGSAAVIAFILLTGGLRLTAADLLLLAAVVTCAMGYAEGGRLSRELGSWRVLSWALVLACPFLAVPVAVSVWEHGLHASLGAWAAFAYMGVVSMFLAFWAWYEGLSLGGVARVSQTQLLQVFLTLAAARFINGENIAPSMLVAATVVVACVAVARRAPIGVAR